MCKNVKSLAEELHVVRECQKHQSQAIQVFFFFTLNNELARTLLIIKVKERWK